jgi:selenide,water dikinase
LNRSTAEVCRSFTVHAATDVTGFGLVGHAFEMAQGSDAQLEIQMDALPIMAEALKMYERGMRTGVNAEIRRLVNSHILFTRQFPVWHEEILFDPQTSGGLLLSVPSEQTDEMLNALKADGVTTAVCIGRVQPYDGHHFLKIK